MNKKIETEPGSTPVFGQPDTAEELINKYGTYNIQPTCDSDNDYPKIAQALPKCEKDKKYGKGKYVTDSTKPPKHI